MKIISWNVNGIRAVVKKEAFLPFVKKFNPDVLCLQETKAEKHQAQIDLKDYKEFWNSAIRKGYSGTAIFSKNDPIKVISNIPETISKKYKYLKDTYGDANLEGRVIAAEYKDFFVVNVYTPNAKDDLSRIPFRHKIWDTAFLEYVCELDKKKPVIFMGDLNVAHTPIDLANPKQNLGHKGFTLEEREGIDNIISKGFVDTFRIFNKDGGHYTWWSHFANARARNVGWRIDYIFVSKRLVKKVKTAKILPEIFGSDHCPIMIEIK